MYSKCDSQCWVWCSQNQLRKEAGVRVTAFEFPRPLTAAATSGILANGILTNFICIPRCVFSHGLGPNSAQPTMGGCVAVGSKQGAQAQGSGVGL